MGGGGHRRVIWTAGLARSALCRAVWAVSGARREVQAASLVLGAGPGAGGQAGSFVRPDLHARHSVEGPVGMTGPSHGSSAGRTCTLGTLPLGLGSGRARLVKQLASRPWSPAWAVAGTGRGRPAAGTLRSALCQVACAVTGARWVEQLAGLARSASRPAWVVAGPGGSSSRPDLHAQHSCHPAWVVAGTGGSSRWLDLHARSALCRAAWSVAGPAFTSSLPDVHTWHSAEQPGWCQGRGG